MVCIVVWLIELNVNFLSCLVDGVGVVCDVMIRMMMFSRKRMFEK